VLRVRQRETPPLEWSALYQQRPVPDTGDYFKSSWFVYHDNLPDRARMRFYGASDYACTSGGGDWTCHVVVGVDHAGKLYLCDLRRMQSDPAEWVEQMCDMVRAWRPWGWAEEGGQIRASVGPFLTARLKERKAHVWRRQFPTRGDKSLRARSIQGRLSMDGISLPRGAPWVPEFLKELLSFPAGRHDDMVDALGLVGQLLDVMQPGAPPEPPKPDQ
jgi:predicted phage terminase large subunit-like protein